MGVKHGKAKRHTSGARPARSQATKLKKTFSLSRESVEFLQQLSAAHRSDSEALDALIREKRAEAERTRVGAAITEYYDSLTDAQVNEDRAWGEFALKQMSQDNDNF